MGRGRWKAELVMVVVEGDNDDRLWGWSLRNGWQCHCCRWRRVARLCRQTDDGEREVVWPLYRFVRCCQLGTRMVRGYCLWEQ